MAKAKVFLSSFHLPIWRVWADAIHCKHGTNSHLVWNTINERDGLNATPLKTPRIKDPRPSTEISDTRMLLFLDSFVGCFEARASCRAALECSTKRCHSASGATGRLDALLWAGTRLVTDVTDVNGMAEEHHQFIKWRDKNLIGWVSMLTEWFAWSMPCEELTWMQ